MEPPPRYPVSASAELPAKPDIVETEEPGSGIVHRYFGKRPGNRNFPIIGNCFMLFSNRWKNSFRFFQSLEKNPMNRSLLFFDWSKPALAHAAEYLARPENWAGGLLDLSRHLVIVPSSHAGRRLREQLAVLAAERHSAVLPGRITTPSVLFQPDAQHSWPVADSVDAAILWQDVLSRLPDHGASALFRGGAPSGDRRICAAIARQLARLRALLCEEGHSFASFAAAYTANPEPDRWSDLVHLEDLYLQALEREKLRDDTAAKCAAAQTPSALLEFDSVHLLFCPDPPRLALRALQALPDSIPLYIGILAPEPFASLFDEWGRPAPAAWTERIIPVEETQIHRFASPQEEIRYIADQLASLSPEKRTACAVGIPDGTLAPALRGELASRGVPSFDPAGCAAAQIALTELVLLFGRLFVEPAYESFAALVRHPYLLDFFKSKNARFQTVALLSALDTFQNLHLPSDFEAVRRFAKDHPHLKPVAAQVADWMQRLQDETPLNALQPILAECFAERTFDNRRPNEADFIASARLLASVLDSLRRRPLVLQLSAAEMMQLILDELEHQRLPVERPADAVDLPGWLELHWENAPQLLLCGMTDTAVPEVIDSHPFLPDQARRALHLRDNADRFARDAYIFNVLIASRPGDPSTVQCCLAATGLTGDPTHPSRLLFQCAPDRLPARALLLFGECASAQMIHHRVNDWRLRPPAPDTLPAPEHIAVSDLNSYLRCPFLYYLERRLHMEPLDDTLLEMEASTYGTFCHGVFQDFAASPVADSCSENEIADFLTRRTAERFYETFGPRLSLPLMIQQESMQERLRFAARAQAQARRAGWKLEAVEQAFAMPLRGVLLRGRIDRIERRDDGAIRLLDYKTSDYPADPAEAHLKKQNDRTPSWAVAPGEREWKNLQLPLYQLLYRNTHSDEAPQITCGYFNLSGAAETTGIREWEIEPELLNAAQAVADDLAGRILRGLFWPPRGAKAYGPLAELFFDTPEQTVDAAGFPKEAL